MTTLYGPDGRPIHRVPSLNDEEDLEYDDGRQKVTISPRKTLMEMAMAQRNGASLRAIVREFELVGAATNPRILQRSLDIGHDLLRQAEEQFAARARGEAVE